MTRRHRTFAAEWMIRDGIDPEQFAGGLNGSHHRVSRTDTQHKGDEVGFGGSSFNVEVALRNTSLERAREVLQNALAELDRMAALERP